MPAFLYSPLTFQGERSQDGFVWSNERSQHLFFFPMEIVIVDLPLKRAPQNIVGWVWFECEAAFSHAYFRNRLVCSELCPVGVWKCPRMPLARPLCTQLVAVLNLCSCVVNTAGSNINWCHLLKRIFLVYVQKWTMSHFFQRWLLGAGHLEMETSDVW